MAELHLDSPLQFIKGVGPRKAEVLAAHNMQTVQDLLFYFPRSYLDRTTVLSIGDVRTNESVTIIGVVRAHGLLYGRARRHRYEVILGDETGDITLVFFEGVRYWKTVFRKGMVLAATGTVRYYGGKQLIHPDLERLEDDSDKMIHAGRIIPVYPQTSELNRVGLSSKNIRKLTSYIFDNLDEQIPDYLPVSVTESLNLSPINVAVKKIHYPDSRDEVEESRKRLAFDELLAFQYLVFKRKEQKNRVTKKHSYNQPGQLLKKFKSALPFQYTAGQVRAINDIFRDLQSNHPMSRLLQGDVGCGKTVVAVTAALYVAENSMQTAFMAPTEILAEQHYRNWRDCLKNLGVTTGLITSTTKNSDKKEIAERCQAGDISILFGTHALIYEYVEFARLGLVIIDEQHRFGVEQRSKLYSKGDNPDLLVMTATPIPRTLALTLYGDLEFSTIDTMPEGRIPIRTVWRESSARHQVYEYVKDEVKKGGQAYIIYPLIEKSDKTELRSVEDAFKELASGAFRDCRTAMIHGRVRPADREKTLERFRNGRLDILFATTVIEVGIDNPNATLMVIEHAERFGLSQLHQLRGRVGRGRKESKVIAIADTPISEIAGKRLEYFVSTNDGFKISESDLELRGAGEFFGTRQSGMPKFKVANIATDQKLIDTSRELLSGLFSGDTQSIPDSVSILRHLEEQTVSRLVYVTGG